MQLAQIRMPRMGSGVHAGTVLEWKKSPGQSVVKGEVLLDAESDKVDFELESPADGVLREILVEDGREVPVGEVLALLETEAALPDEVPDLAVDAPAAVSESRTRGPGLDEWVAPIAPPLRPDRAGLASRELEPAPSARGAGRRNWLSPRVQRLAREHGLPLERVAALRGSGAGGRVTGRDVEAFLSGATPSESASVETPEVPLPPMPLMFEPLAASADAREIRELHSRTRLRIAERLTHSARDIPQVTNLLDVDMSRIHDWRSEHKGAFRARHGLPLTYTPFFALAIIAALRDPANARFNATYDDDAVLVRRYVDLGIAVETDRGLLVPVLRDADRVDFVGLVRGIEDLAARARSGDLAPREVQDGTITLTNFGVTGALSANPLIKPPQVAIVGTGAVAPRVAALPRGAIGVRPVMTLGVTFDHRANDGVAAGRFLAAIGTALERMDLASLHY